jgi:Leucine-rich repeat (LRR) protein
MKWLSMLNLKGNAVSDLAPLEPLTELKFLFLDNNKVADITPLHRAWKKDNDTARNWAPYCEITLTGNPLSDASKKLAEELKTAGARIKP